MDNIRAALDWCLSAARRACAPHVSALERFWRMHGQSRRRGGGRPSRSPSRRRVARDARGRALGRPSRRRRRTTGRGDPLLEEALRLFRDARALARGLFASLSSVGRPAAGDRERAEELCEEALEVARTGDAGGGLGAAQESRGRLSTQGDHGRARRTRGGARAPARRSTTRCSSPTRRTTSASRPRSRRDRARRPRVEETLSSRPLGDNLHTAAAVFTLAELDLLAGERSGRAAIRRVSRSTRTSRTTSPAPAASSSSPESR